MIATASASAASGPAIFTPGSSRATIAWTCAFSAPPVPTTAFLTSARRIFADGDPGARGAHQRDAARLAELERRLRVLVDEHFLDRGGVGPVLGEQRFELVGEPRQALRQRRQRIGLDLAVGDVGEAVALGLDQAPAGRAEAGIEAEDLQASFSSSSSGTS